MLDIKGKIALVTGGASGIGLACAEELLKNGCMGITIVDVNEERGAIEATNLNQKYGNGKVIFIKANVANKIELEEAFKKTVEVFKHLDIVLNNAGFLLEHDYEKCIDINVKGAAHCLKLAIDEYLPKYKSGQEALIMNTSSLSGLIPYVGVEIYSTTKFALIALTRNYGVDFHYKRTGVRVIAICPDSTDTALVDGINTKIIYKELAPFFTWSPEIKASSQTPTDVAKVCMNLMENADNGSVWYIKLGKETKIDFPDLVKF